MLCLITSLSAFNAILSASVVALGVSYAIPPAINCLRGRKMLPPRPFVLPGPLGWMCNLLGIAYVIVTTVLFLFPPDLPVTGSNMSTLDPLFSFSCILLLYHHNSPPIHYLNSCSHLPHSTLPFLSHPISPSRVSPLTYPQPKHTLISLIPRLLHSRLLHRHRHKRSAMVHRRPQEFQRPRRRTSRRRRRARLRRRECGRQAQVECSFRG